MTSAPFLLQIPVFASLINNSRYWGSAEAELDLTNIYWAIDKYEVVLPIPT